MESLRAAMRLGSGGSRTSLPFPLGLPFRPSRETFIERPHSALSALPALPALDSRPACRLASLPITITCHPHRSLYGTSTPLPSPSLSFASTHHSASPFPPFLLNHRPSSLSFLLVDSSFSISQCLLLPFFKLFSSVFCTNPRLDNNHRLFLSAP